jgi:hypothetical protein
MATRNPDPKVRAAKLVDWYDNCRPPAIGYSPPADAVEAFYANPNKLDMIGWLLNKSRSGKAGVVHTHVWSWASLRPCCEGYTARIQRGSL